VAEDLRAYLDVMEGVKCMVYGRPNFVNAQKASLYFTYAPNLMRDPVAKISEGAIKYDLKDDETADQHERGMEQII